MVIAALSLALHLRRRRYAERLCRRWGLDPALYERLLALLPDCRRTVGRR